MSEKHIQINKNLHEDELNSTCFNSTAGGFVYQYATYKEEFLLMIINSLLKQLIHDNNSLPQSYLVNKFCNCIYSSGGLLTD